jgi:PAS domain S-box-containing protein
VSVSDQEPLRVEELLRLRERAVAAVSSGIVITDAGLPDDPVIDANPAFVRMTGYARSEVLGRNCRLLQGRHTSDPERATIRAALAAQREITVTILNERKDGTPFWNELHIAPVFDGDGRRTHSVGVQTDVTERRQAEERDRFLAEVSDVLASSLDYAATLERVAELAVPRIADWCVVDMAQDGGTLRRLAIAHGDPTKRARAWAMGERYPPAASGSHSGASALRTGRPALIPTVADAALVAYAQDAVHLKYLRDLGLLSALSVPLRARGRTLGVITLMTAESGRRLGPNELVLAEDLARRAAMAVDNAKLFGEAQAAVRARDQFLSIAAHELRTPVASIKGYAQMLLRGHRKGKLSDDRLARSLETIDAATDRLSLLTSDLLDVSRIRLGQLPLRPRLVDLAALVNDLAGRYAETLGEQHPIQTATPETPCLAVADPDRLEQVLANLIDNAAKYSPAGGPIRLTAAEQGDGARIEVRDAGIGLPPEETGSVFEPFARATNALEHNLPGLGLGLYICRGIVERHHGRIWATSEGNGRGTTFAVWLPKPGKGLEAADASPIS